MEGQVVSHFRVKQRLGGGGMGVVYTAEDLRLRRTVALKFLPPHVTGDAQSRRRFVREARAASALDHPNICTIFEIDETDDGQVFMAMAYYPGETLRRRIERGALPVRDALDLTIQLARALARAHEQGIVHRDVKPSNIQVTDDGLLKLLDFGLAKLSDQSRLTRSGAVVGTVAYMSPEQLQNEPIDARTDVWSLGVALHEMLTGELPFAGNSEAAMILSIVQQETPDLSALVSGVPRSVTQIVVRALTKEKEDRYEDAGEILAELETARMQMSTALTETRLDHPVALRAGRRRARRRVAWGVSVAAAIALAVAGTVWVTGPKGRAVPAEAPRSIAVLPFTNLTGDPSRDYIPEGMSAVLIGQLATLPEVSVVGSSEAWAYRRRGLTLSSTEMARELGVEAILEGRYFESGGESRVQLSLVRGGDGRVIWSREVEADADELIDLQGRLLRQLAEELAVPLSSDEQMRLSERPTESDAAYRLFLQAKAQNERYGEPGALERSIELYRQTLEVDPDLSEALAELSRALVWQWETERDEDLLREAELAARRALELDPALPAGRVALAGVLQATGQADEAIRTLVRLTANHPDLAGGHAALMEAYKRTDQFGKAEASIRRAISLRPDYWGYWNGLGALLLTVGEYDGAEEAFEEAAQLTEVDLMGPVANLAGLALSRGDFEGAVTAFERLPRPIEDPGVATNIGTAYFYVDRLDEAERYYRLAVRLGPTVPMFRANLADCYLRQGRSEQAVDAYQTAAELQAARVVESSDDGEQVRLAMYRAKAGQCDEAVAVGESVERTLIDTWQTAYGLAKVYAVCDDREATFRALDRATELGLTGERIAGDDEFRAVADDPRFEALVGG